MGKNLYVQIFQFILFDLSPHLSHSLELVEAIVQYLPIIELFMYLWHEIGLFPFLLYLLFSFFVEQLFFSIFWIFFLCRQYFPKILTQRLWILVVGLKLFVVGCISFHVPDDLDVFEHRWRDDVVEPDVSFEDSHAVVKVAAFYDLFIQIVEENFLESPGWVSVLEKYSLQYFDCTDFWSFILPCISQVDN